MQKLGLSQTLSQKLSPQQIQFIKLLQVPTAELEARIEEELETNPALEEGKEENSDDLPEEEYEETDYENDEINVEDYLRDDDFSGYKMQGDGSAFEEREMPIATSSSLPEQLLSQLGFLGLDERQTSIGTQLIGSIENDGYIRRDLEAIINDLAFSMNIETSLEEVEAILSKIQNFDPPGIAARNLQECLLLQLKRKEDKEEIHLAIRILSDCFEEFTKKHYQKIMKKLGVEEEELFKLAVDHIIKLNPKPGSSGAGMVKNQYLLPDYILTKIMENWNLL
jgi:RNA polymerase sigma-54 factor